MKPTPKSTCPPSATSRKGIALLTVLALLTLTAVIILAFFSISQTELTSTSSYAKGAEAQQLAKTAVDMVMHQIRAGTEKSGVAWSSQPGMIRTWARNNNSNRFGAFKLYSDDEMVLTADFSSSSTPSAPPPNFAKELVEDFDELALWYDTRNKDVFVDLNEPILRSDGDKTKVYYPILDPRAYVKGAEKSSVTPADWNTPSSSVEDRYQEVEGFHFETQRVPRGDYPRKDGNRIDHFVGLPMPVKWIYQLEDGTLGTLLRQGSSIPKFEAISGAGIPSRKNPIVARFAFWTDDETSKINVNTAAGGKSWDTPRAGGMSDRQYGKRQPVQKEYQRYPAHPATTSLGPVLFPNRLQFGQAGYDARAQEIIYEMVPRVVPGGSAGAQQDFTTDSPPVLEPDRDRLFATIDEFIFRAPKRGESGFGSSDYRRTQPVPATWGEIDGEYLDRVKFFLTANSRAPEVTVFNTPRISVWPSYYTPHSKSEYQKYHNSALTQAYYSAFDARIRLCAEMGIDPSDLGPNGEQQNFGYQYHFQRLNSESRHEDMTEIKRNRELFAYLLWLMRQPIPGVGGSFDDKYNAKGTQQIATEMFDYIRSLNLFDDSLFARNKDTPGTPADAKTNKARWSDNPDNHYAYTNKRALINVGGSGNRDRHQHAGHGQVAPIEIPYPYSANSTSYTGAGNVTKGFGRFVTLNEAGISFIATATRTEGGPFGPRKAHWEENGTEWYKSTTNFDWSNVPPLNPQELQKDDTGFRRYLASLYSVTPDQFTDDMIAFARQSGNWNHTLKPETPLAQGETRIQAMLLFSIFCPSLGWTSINPDFRMEVDLSGSWSVTNVKTQDSSAPIGFPSGKKEYRTPGLAWGLPVHGTRDNGGIFEPRCFWMSARLDNPGSSRAYYRPTTRYVPTVYNELKDDPARGNPYKENGKDADSQTAYHWVGVPQTIKASEGIKFSGGTMEIKIFPGNGQGSDPDDPNDGPNDYGQRAVIDMKSVDLPAPELSEGRAGNTRGPRGNRRTVPNSDMDPRTAWSLHRDGALKDSPDGGRPLRFRTWPNGNGALVQGNHDVTRSYVVPHGDYRVVFAQRELTSSDNQNDNTADFVPQKDYDSNKRIASNFCHGNSANGYGNEAEDQLVEAANAPKGLRPQLPSNFEADRDNQWGDFDNTVSIERDGAFINKPDEGNSRGVDNAAYNPDPAYGSVPRNHIPYFNEPWTHEPAGASFWSPNRIMPGPGAFGSLPTGIYGDRWNSSRQRPWQTLLFRPLWDPNGRGANNDIHPGFRDPKDHYVLDFFWMPVVEPWSISESLSTAGKVNMNYAMQPFSHIKRTSALLGVFASEEMLTIPNDWGRSYKAGTGYGRGYDWWAHQGGDLQQRSLRSYVNAKESLRQFEAKFNSPSDRYEKGEGSLFRTASELCEQWLVPSPVRFGNHSSLNENLKVEDMKRVWDPTTSSGLGLVGDNSKERPYTNLVSRLTTKSNTYQVHYRAQIVRQAPMSPTNPGQRRSDDEYAIFDSDVDGVAAEYRGSTIIERYLDPNDSDIPDYGEMAANGSLQLNSPSFKSLDRYYRFRVVSEKRFAP